MNLHRNNITLVLTSIVLIAMLFMSIDKPNKNIKNSLNNLPNQNTEDNKPVNNVTNNSIEQSINELVIKSKDELTDNPMYIIKPLDGFLAIYVPNTNSPVSITEIDMRTLRESDKEYISNGIMLYSQEELASFLEDFGS